MTEKTYIGKYLCVMGRTLSFNARLYALLFMVVCLVFSSQRAIGAEDLTSLESGRMSPVPDEYGSIIYRCNENSPRQLYIIGMSHRDTLTGLNGDITVDSQVEVYRITEGLIKSLGLALVLPEGYFSRGATSERSAVAAGVSLDTTTLKARLSDEAVRTNAEVLLMESYGINLLPVEDTDMYNAVRAKVRDLENEGGLLERQFIRSELAYLQERRVAAMLQNIPGIIEREYKSGSISAPNAVFTIGLHHLAEIVRYLRDGKIEIPSPVFTPFEDYSVDISLLREDFGVTVIVPRSLAGEHDRMLLTKLKATE